MDEFSLRFVPLGGIVGVTKNMYLYELYKAKELIDILIVDCGIGFTSESELGVDYLIPDISYLEDKKDKIRAVVLTHGHDDHISALRFHYKALGEPPVYADKLTARFTEKKFDEFGIKTQINLAEYRKDYSFGNFKARFIHLTHSIPDTTHVLIKSPAGSVYHGSDFKIDLTPPYWDPPDLYEIAAAGEQGVLCLLSDCLGAVREGYTLSESVVGQTFEDEMRAVKGKVIMTTFSSNISRIRQCVEAAAKFNRRVCFMGRSMRQNFEIAAQMGYLPIPKNFLIEDKQIHRYPPNHVCIIAAGSQGQYDSALSKIVQGSNRFVKLKPGDKVIFSSDPIPGQEDDVYETIEQIIIAGADVVYSDIAEQLHASGHGNREDLKLLVRLTKPKYLIPIGGTIRHQRQYQEMVGSLGYSQNKVFLLEEGETVIFKAGKASVDEPVKTKNVFVDAYGVGDVGNIILRDRKTLATEGFVSVVLVMDRNLDLVSNPEFISRGFVFGEDEKEIFDLATNEVIAILNNKKGKPFERSKTTHEIIGTLENYFKKKTGRNPLVLVSILQV